MYWYDVKRDLYVIPPPTLARMMRRASATKEQCAAEDNAENERRIRADNQVSRRA